jgi:hypothetical protein
MSSTNLTSGSNVTLPTSPTPSIDPVAASINDLLAILTLPALNGASPVSSLPASITSGNAGLNGLLFMNALSAWVEGLANSAWVDQAPVSEYALYTSEAKIAASIAPALFSLGSIEVSMLMSRASAQSAALSVQSASLSALSVLEASLASRSLTFVTTTIGTATAIVTKPLLVPLDLHQKGKLTTGQKIGLGLGVPAFLIAAASIAFLLFHVRRNRHRSQQPGFIEQLPVPEPTRRKLIPRDEPSGSILRGCCGSPSNNGPITIDDDDDFPHTVSSTRPRRQRPRSYDSGIAVNNALQYGQSHYRRPISVGGIPHNSRRHPTQRALDLFGMAYGLDPINDRSVDMIAAAHGLGWNPVEADSGEINSFAHPVEMPATPVPEQHEAGEDVSAQSTKGSGESTKMNSEGGVALSEETLPPLSETTPQSEKKTLSQKDPSSETHDDKHDDLYDA